MKKMLAGAAVILSCYLASDVARAQSSQVITQTTTVATRAHGK
jgi:hypothetical protein